MPLRWRRTRCYFVAVTALPDTRGAEGALRFLANATAELTGSLDYDATVAAVARVVVPALADWCTVDLVNDRGQLHRAAGSRIDKTLDVLALPLTARGRTIGVLTLGRTPASGREYDDGDIAFAEEVAARAAVAVDNALLHRAEQQARDTLRATNRRLELLSASATRFLLEAEPTAFVRDAFRELTAALDLDVFFHYEVDEHARVLRLASVGGVSDDVAARVATLQYGNAVCGHAALERAPVVAEDVQHSDDPRADLLRELGLSAYACHPLIARGRLVGTLGFGSRRRSRFEPDDVVLIRAVSDQVAAVIDRRQREHALRASEARLRSIVDSNMIGIAFWDGGRVTDANQALLDMLGYTREDLDAGLLRHGRLTPPEYAVADARATAEARARGSCAPYEKEFLRKDGSRLPGLVGGASFPEGGGVFFILDLTGLRSIQEQLHAAQRMDAVGRLAGGVAHEINNALQAVIGFAGFALRDVAPEHPARADLAEVDRAARRAATITQQLLAFGRRQLMRPETLDLNTLVQDFTPVLRQALGPGPRLVIREAAAPIAVVADRGQLEQVLLNLALNARDAMDGRGSLTVRVGRVSASPPDVPAAAALRPGPYGVLEIIDTGHGMDAATRARVFEPFFTTKEPGSGTGLGLSVVHGIVAQSGGAVRLVSEPGFGAAFTVLLPEAGSGPAGLTIESPLPDVGTGNETVLVVDDDPLVLDVTRRALTEHGYHVLAAASVRDALHLAQRASIDLLVTDVAMTGSSGPALAEALQTARADSAPLRTLYISGYTADEVVRRRLLRPEQPFLQKPFDGDALARRVRQMLDERAREIEDGGA